MKKYILSIEGQAIVVSAKNDKEAIKKCFSIYRDAVNPFDEPRNTKEACFFNLKYLLPVGYLRSLDGINTRMICKFRFSEAYFNCNMIYCGFTIER